MTLRTYALLWRSGFRPALLRSLAARRVIWHLTQDGIDLYAEVTSELCVRPAPA